MINKVEICGVNTSKLPVLSNEEKNRLLNEIKKDKDKTYLIVAHNGIARSVNSYFKDMANEDFAAYAIKNCELLCYEFENTNKEAD